MPTLEFQGEKVMAIALEMDQPGLVRVIQKPDRSGQADLTHTAYIMGDEPCECGGGPALHWASFFAGERVCDTCGRRRERLVSEVFWIVVD